MKAIVLVNEQSGACAADGHDRACTAISSALAAVRVNAEVRLFKPDHLEKEVKAAAGEGDVVVAAGGDGTVSGVAGVLAGGETPLGVLPMGTLNHFAKDLRIPMDLGGAAKIIAGGHVARVDVGRVNGRVFVNNSSLGVYSEALLQRQATRSRRGVGKWQAMTAAALKTFWRAPMVHVRLEANGDSRDLKTPLVFVGNNRYRLDLLRIGGRDRLDEGLLALYVATTSTRWGMLKLMSRAMVGRLKQSRDFETLVTKEVTIWRRKETLVAADGELERMEPPLKYESWPGALKVIVPEGV
jgi:diacylglycerol kinase family enzyme